MLPTLDDDRVVTRVRGGDRGLFEVLMRRYNQRIYRAVRSFLRDEAEVEDVMQQTYLRAFLHLDQLAETAKVSAWLVRIAIHLAIDRVRQRRRLAESELGGDDLPAGKGDEMRSPEAELSDRELARFLEAALEDLPELYRVVFLLREIEGMSTEEVATALDVSDSVVKVRLHRAKDRLKKGLLARAGRAAPDVFAFRVPRCDRVVAAVLGRIASLEAEKD